MRQGYVFPGRAALWPARAAVLALLVVLGASAAQAQGNGQPSTVALDAKKGYTIPFQYDPLQLPFIVVQVRVNGGEPASFAVDTGCSAPLVLFKWEADKLKVQPTGPPMMVKPGNTQIVPVAVHDVSLQGPDVTGNLPIDTAYVLDMGDYLDRACAGPRLAGLVGMPVLQQITTRFDFAAKTMTVFLDANPPLQVPGAVSLPLKPYQWGYGVSLEPLPGKPVDLFLDTGNSTTGLPMEALQDLKGARTVKDVSMSADQSVHVKDRFLIRRFALGTFHERDVAVSQMPKGDEPALGLLLLSRFRVTLDPRNGCLLLERPEKRPAGAQKPGDTGIDIVQRGEDIVVETVHAGSPAERAGVRSGDRVLQVDGQPIARMPIAVARRVLNGFTGTRAELDLARANGQTVRVAFVRADAFAARSNALAGVSMLRNAGGPLRVTHVRTGCPAAAAGLATGDEVAEIGGEPGATVPPEQLAACMEKPMVALRVRSAGGPVREILVGGQR